MDLSRAFMFDCGQKKLVVVVAAGAGAGAAVAPLALLDGSAAIF